MSQPTDRRQARQHKRMPPMDSIFKAPADMTDEEIAATWLAANEPAPTAEDVEFFDNRRINDECT